MEIFGGKAQGIRVAQCLFRDQVEDHIVGVKGFIVLKQDRNTETGGVLLYVRNDLKAKVLVRSKTTHKVKLLKPEFIFCAIWSKQVPPLLVSVICTELRMSH